MIHITLHRPEEYAAYERRISELEEQVRKKQLEVYQMQAYGDQLLRALDELRVCQKAMNKAGLDTSFIRSLRRGR